MRRFGTPLLRALATAALLGSCILPPPVSLDQGTDQNPFIVSDGSIPKTAEIRLNLNCTTCTFQVHAEDPDTGDYLYARWYWDYDETQLLAYESAPIAPASGNAPRLNAKYPINDVTQLFKTQLNANKTDVHTLQVLVSDLPFQTGATAPPIEQATSGLTASLRWTVEFVTEGTACDVSVDLCPK